MSTSPQISPAKCKDLLKTFGPCPAGKTQDDLERMDKNLVPVKKQCRHSLAS